MMIQQNSTWLSVSLFCNRAYWHHVLSAGISPFLTTLPNSALIDSYRLEFNYDRGENLRLSFLARTEKADELAYNIDLFFNQFLNEAKFPEDFPEKPFNGIFMPFPPNTIQYGVYSPPKAEENDLINKYSFERRFSELIINVLGEDYIDEEALFTFGFYVHLLWIKTLRQSRIPHHEQNKLLRYYATPVSNIDSSVSDYFNDRQESLKEVYGNIMNPTGALDAVGELWFEEWTKLCQEELNKIRFSKDDPYTINTFDSDSIPFMIDRQLGYNHSNGRTLISYFINQLITSN